jgi:hypothetical protein
MPLTAHKEEGQQSEVSQLRGEAEGAAFLEQIARSNFHRESKSFRRYTELE